MQVSESWDVSFVPTRLCGFWVPFIPGLLKLGLIKSNTCSTSLFNEWMNEWFCLLGDKGPSVIFLSCDSYQIFWYLKTTIPFSQFSCSVVSDSWRPHGMEHTRIPCLSPAPRNCSNSCPSSRWSNHLILCRPLLLLPSVFPRVRVFSNESAPQQMANEYSGLISFRIDWLGPLAVQGTQESSLINTLLHCY